MKKTSKMLIISAFLMTIITLTVASVARGDENSPSANTAGALSQDGSLVSIDSYLPLLYKKYDVISEPTVFGVQMPGNTGQSSPYYDYMIDSGSSWIRVPIAWWLIEPEKHNPAVYNWNSADTFTQAAQPSQGELKLIVTIAGNPEWAAELRNGPIDPEHIGAYAAFFAAAVERYDGDGIDDAPGSPKVNYWEIYNEPDRGLGSAAPSTVGWGYDGDKYAALLEVIYPVMKAANPQAQLVMGGMAYDWFEDQGGPYVREFLDDVLTAGGGDYIDIMNFHVYPPYWFNWTSPRSPGLLEKANFVMDKLASYGYPNMPFLITEAGWHSNDHPSVPGDPETQARFVVEFYTQSIAAGSETLIWFKLYDDPLGAYAFMNGLVTNIDNGPLAPKLAYMAFQTALKEIGSADFHRILPDGETGHSRMEAYELRDPILKRTVYVAWMDPIDTTVVAPLRVPASVAIVRTIYDSAHLVYDSQDGQVDGKVTVDVGGQPVFIEVDW